MDSERMSDERILVLQRCSVRFVLILYVLTFDRMVIAGV